MSAAFISKEELDICVTLQLRSSGGGEGEPITSNTSLGRLSKRWQRESHNDGGQCALVTLGIQMLFSNRLDGKIPSPSAGPEQTRPRLFLLHLSQFKDCQVCLSRNTVIIYHKMPTSDASLKHTLNKYFFSPSSISVERVF